MIITNLINIYWLVSSPLIIRGVGHCGIPNLLPLGRTCRSICRSTRGGTCRGTCRSTCRSTNSFLGGAKCRTMSGRRPNISLALQRVVSHLLIWLVVSTPLKNISQWEGLSRFMENKKCLKQPPTSHGLDIKPREKSKIRFRWIHRGTHPTGRAPGSL